MTCNEQKLNNGKIVKGVGGFYTVLGDDGERHTCKARGLFRKTGQTPLPGDDVSYELDKIGQGYIMQILPRRNALLRPAVANVDKLLIVIAATEPEPDLELVDKLLLYCKKLGITPVLVVNKCDDTSADSVPFISQYDGEGIITEAVSAVTGRGMENLMKLLEGDTICLAGQSAVGKTSLLNTLLGLSMETGGLSKKTERGRHTTRHAELLPLPGGGLIADTPGFSMLESVPLEPEEIACFYGDFKEHDAGCRFVGCMHLAEPGCAVKEAVKAGLISEERYKRYAKIVNEALEARRHKYD